MNIILIILACGAPLVAICVWVQQKDRPLQFITYAITLSATFAGVWLALLQSDMDKTKDEKQQVVALTDAAMSTLEDRWSLERLSQIPFLDQMAANPLLPKYFEPMTFQGVVGFNVILSDPHFEGNSDTQQRVYEVTYYMICMQRKVLLNIDLRNSMVELRNWYQINRYNEKDVEKQMRKDGCFIADNVIKPINPPK